MRKGRPRTTECEYDPIAVERLVAGRHAGTPTAADGWEAVRRLARMGFTDGQIALRTGYTRRSAWRIRTALGIPAVLRANGANQYDRPVPEPSVYYRAA